MGETVADSGTGREPSLAEPEVFFADDMVVYVVRVRFCVVQIRQVVTSEDRGW